MNWSIVTRFINCRSWVARPLAQEMEPETAMFGILGRLCTEIWEAFLWKERNTQQVCREKEEAYTPESDRSIESSALITVQFPWGTHSALLVTPKHLHKNAASTSNQGSFSGLPFLTTQGSLNTLTPHCPAQDVAHTRCSVEAWWIIGSVWDLKDG